ncbi:membrane associated rhomboid family serine protease [Lutibacter sp. Hel_I_33_5]|uniref:rhomboid family intramembrane serine protease n=1 Tax=Lutibacter sp. Hel_I_33_5 TaxID=1566289 RepID=UPI0011A664AB|nr:rhomboid family intramembrane serine protease [Lutibacter sp. Hel_I_33_5]TVZ55117.1 membrane associated rhomboid family serine protease [Lutibacter sp. Hel_I_33_5]
MDILENIKIRFKKANIVEQLIYINLGVFFIVFLFNTFGFLFNVNSNFIVDWFALPATFDGLLSKPWTLITYGFLHASFLHILLNLIALFYFGNLFLEYFTPKQLINFYVLGTVFGGIVFLLSYNIFPAFSNQINQSILLGASAGISAIFIGIATYMPNYQLKLRFIGFIKLWHLAAIWVALDVIQIPAGNAGGHLAHIGGALFGFLFVSFASNTKIDLLKPIRELFSKKRKPLKTVHKSKNVRKKKDVKSNNQQQIDGILDKISKSGYDTLTKEEKAFLFKQGKK